MTEKPAGAGRKGVDPQTQKTEAGALRAIWETQKSIKGFTQETAAEEMGWNTQGVVSQYLNGVIPLNHAAALKFARFLGCQVRDFSPRLAAILPESVDQNSDSVNERSVSKGRNFESDFLLGSDGSTLRPALSNQAPIVGDIRTGVDKDWIEQGRPREYGDLYVAHASSDSDEVFALRVVGQDLAPRYMEGDCLLIDPLAQPQPGDEVFCLIDGKTDVRRLVSRRNNEITTENILSGSDRTVHPESVVESLGVIVSIATQAALRRK